METRELVEWAHATHTRAARGTRHDRRGHQSYNDKVATRPCTPHDHDHNRHRDDEGRHGSQTHDVAIRNTPMPLPILLSAACTADRMNKHEVGRHGGPTRCPVAVCDGCWERNQHGSGVEAQAPSRLPTPGVGNAGGGRTWRACVWSCVVVCHFTCNRNTVQCCDGWCARAGATS